jgi:hypothetical protein
MLRWPHRRALYEAWRAYSLPSAIVGRPACIKEGRQRGRRRTNDAGRARLHAFQGGRGRQPSLKAGLLHSNLRSTLWV